MCTLDAIHLRDPKQNIYYVLWYNIKARCLNPKHKFYYRYGGRGITLIDEWLDFDVFVDDILRTIGHRPEGMSLDRVDNDGNYEPGNVQWTTPLKQAHNRHTAPRKSGASHFRGVHWYTRLEKWKAQGSRNKKYKHLGYFKEEEEAARAYDTWALAEYGPTYEGFNFPEEVVQCPTL